MTLTASPADAEYREPALAAPGGAAELGRFLHADDGPDLAGLPDYTVVITAALDRATAGRTTRLAVSGTSGTGRTRLVEHARREAARRSMRVLATHGKAADRDVPFGSLLTLLHPVADRIQHLPPAERASLQAALDLHDAVDERTARTGLWRLLTRLTDEAPLLVTADDCDLMDAATLGLLAFALGRMDAQRAALVAAAGSGATSNPLVAIADEAVVLDGLDVEALVRAVHASVPATDWVVRRMASFAGGDPAMAVDLVRSLTADQRAGRAACPQVPPPPREVARAVVPVLGALSAPARALLVLVTADTTGDLHVVRSAARALDIPAGALGELEQAGHLAIAGAVVRLRRPMLGIVAYDQLDPAARRRLHRALADAMTAPEHVHGRAWHLAASSEGPDDAVARAMTAVSTAGAARGDHRLAALAAQRAADFAEHHQARSDALVRALGLWTLVGDTVAMRRILDDDRDEPVAAHLARSAARRWLDGDGAAVAELRKAASCATTAERPLIDALFADAALACGHAREAEEAAQRVLQSGDHGAARNLAEAILVLGGRAPASRLTPPERETPAGSGEAAGLHLARAVVGSRALLRQAEARLLYGDADGAAALLGDPADVDTQLPWDAVMRTALRARLTLRRGHLAAARQDLVTALDKLPSRATVARARLREVLAEAQLILGDGEAAMATLDEVLPVVHRASMARVEASALVTAGRIGWAVGETDVAVSCLQRARRLDPSAPIGELVALLVELGRDEPARTWLARLDVRPNDAEAPIDVLRARASASADTAGFQRAAEVLRRAQLVVPEAELAIDLAAWYHRRARWADVHRAGALAARLLVPTGIEAWNDRLDRLEPPAPPPVDDVPPELESLTDAERRVALAIARGLTNKEAAAELFVSVKTVDSHLQRIYPKLNVRSRAELAVLVSSALAGSGLASGAGLGRATGNPPDAGR